ncbi:hypothetical protein [Desulfovibrio ferrophilus]|uniref:hypothetical protein n=1 Tax=Desulfovibrio ferrophilus TaxID=241368 RepID=UPI000F81AC5C|nr:hypothetical protein [Desulfovibrio ferrophilus]
MNYLSIFRTALPFLRMAGIEVNRQTKLPVHLSTKTCCNYSSAKQDNPFLFANPTPLDIDVSLSHYSSIDDLAQCEDAQSYFKPSIENGTWSITDNYSTSQYFCHQLRLFQIYKETFPQGLDDVSLLDIAGSCGYYALHGKQLGMRETKVIEARESPRDIFNTLHKTLGLDESCSFETMDVEYGIDNYNDQHDIVLALGILYHVFDHHRFLRNLHRITNKVALIATRITGREDNYLHMKFEDNAKPRASLHGPSLVPSLNSLASLLDFVGFRNLQLVMLPPEISPRFANYHSGTRALIAAYK